MAVLKDELNVDAVILDVRMHIKTPAPSTIAATITEA